MSNYKAVCATALAVVVMSTFASHAAGMLMGKNEMTLYVFDKDKGGVPSCYDDCAKKWPPYLGKTSDKAEKDWALVKRTDGSMQWTYDKKPLYFFEGDKKKGDMAGDGMGGVWHIIKE